MTTIAWTEKTWNPIVAYDRETGERGWFCTHASPGCLHCYAERMNVWRGNGHLYRVPNLEKVEIRIDERTLFKPLRWRQSTMVFDCSMTDLFHEAHADELIDQVFAVMVLCSQHTFQVLTKRAQRMLQYLSDPETLGRIQACALRLPIEKCNGRLMSGIMLTQLPPNIWLGVSAENQHWGDERIPYLISIPEKVHFGVRWVSFEPALQAVDFSQYLRGDLCCGACAPIDWVVVGGESGSSARPFDPEWARRVVAHAREHNRAAFVKQMGSVVAKRLGYKDAKGENPSEWPEDLRVREYPDVARFAGAVA